LVIPSEMRQMFSHLAAHLVLLFAESVQNYFLHFQASGAWEGITVH